MTDAALQGKYPTSLGDLLKNTHTAVKRAAIMQQLTLKLAPIMEKGMVDAILVHRCLLPGVLRCSAGSPQLLLPPAF